MALQTKLDISSIFKELQRGRASPSATRNGPSQFASLLQARQTVPNPAKPAVQVARAPESNLLAAQLGATAASSKTNVDLAQPASLQSALNAYAETDKTYNDLWKKLASTITLNDVPADFQIKSPGLNPKGYDAVDGVYYPRKVVHYAHELAAQARQALRDGVDFSLPANLAEANPALKAYQDAFKSMPTFNGPAGMNLDGLPSRTMDMHDAFVLNRQLQRLQNPVPTE